MPDQDKDAARADLARLLAACYYEPGPALAEERVFDAIVEAARAVDPALEAEAERLAASFGAESIENLLVDYSRLFLGPGVPLATPYGSAWLGGDGELMQASTMALLDLYAEAGFEIAGDFRELPDHVAAELEFLYLLTFRIVQAQRVGGQAAVGELATLRTRLLGEHLGAWIRPFAEAVDAGAQTMFYRTLAGLTRKFVEAEQVG